MDELRTLDAGYHFSPDGRSYPYRGANVTIPSLCEVLSQLPKQCFLIEPKGYQFELLTQLVNVLDRHSAHDRVIVTPIGLKHSLTRALRTLDGKLRIGHSATEIGLFHGLSRLRLSRLFPARGLSFEAPMRKFGQRIVTERFVADAHHKGISVFVWTVNDIAEMESYVAMGVDGIITDYPQQLTALIDRMRRSDRTP